MRILGQLAGIDLLALLIFCERFDSQGVTVGFRFVIS